MSRWSRAHRPAHEPIIIAADTSASRVIDVPVACQRCRRRQNLVGDRRTVGDAIPGTDHAAGHRRAGTDVAGDDRVDDRRPLTDDRARQDHRARSPTRRQATTAPGPTTLSMQRAVGSTVAVGAIAGSSPVQPATGGEVEVGLQVQRAAGRRRSSSRRWRAPPACPGRRAAGTCRARSTPCVPGSIRSSTDGSSTYVPALIRLDSVSPGAGFSTKRRTAPVGVGLDHAERRRIVDGREVDRRRRSRRHGGRRRVALRRGR